MKPISEAEKNFNKYLRDNPDLLQALQQKDDIADIPNSGCDTKSEDEIQAKVQLIAHRAITTVNRRRTIRRSFIMTVAALIFICFAAPQGRAFAANTYKDIVNLVNGILYIQSGSHNDMLQARTFRQVDPATFTDISDAAKHLDVPLTTVESNNVTIESVTVDSTEAMNSITSIYQTSEGEGFYISQSIASAEGGWGSATDVEANPFEITLYNGVTMYCGYTHEGYAVGIAHWSNIELYITSPTMNWDKLQDYVDKLTEVSNK